MDIQVKKRFGLLSIMGAIVGAASLWFADLYSLLLGVVAVFLSSFASRRGERLNTLGMILGVIAIIFANLQFMDIVKSNSKVGEDIDHLFKSIMISNQAYEIFKNHPRHKRLSDEDTYKLISLWEKAVEEADKVDTNNINSYIPGFSKHYKEQFIKGLQLLIYGFKNSDNSKKLMGAFLMDSWAIWNNKNRDIYIKLKKKRMSLIELLYESMKS